MSAITKAFDNITHGVEKAAGSAVQTTKCLATLDLKGAAASVKNSAAAGADIMRGVTGLTPAAIAVNTLTDGALEKLHEKVQDVGLDFTNRMIDDLEGGLSDMKEGTLKAAQALAKGDLQGAAEGTFQAGMGALNTAEFCSPSGIARKAGEVACEMAVEKVAEGAHEVLGDSGAGGAIADAIGAGTQAGLMALQARHGDVDAGDMKTMGKKFDMKVIKEGAKDVAKEAAEAAAQSMIDSAVEQLMGQLRQQLDPQGNSVVGGMLAGAAQTAIEEKTSHAAAGLRHRAAREPAGADQPARTAGAGTEQAQDLRAGLKASMGSMAEDMVQQVIASAIEEIVTQLMSSLKIDPQSLLGQVARGALTQALQDQAGGPRGSEASPQASGTRPLQVELQGMQGRIANDVSVLSDQASTELVGRTAGLMADRQNGAGGAASQQSQADFKQVFESVLKTALHGMVDQLAQTLGEAATQPLRNQATAVADERSVLIAA